VKVERRIQVAALFASALALLGGAPAIVVGQVFFSGDVHPDHIVRIDGDAATVTSLGNFGWAISGPGMVYKDGTLYWIRIGACSAIYFANADPQALTFGGEVFLTLGGSPFSGPRGSGLAWDGSTFLIAVGKGTTCTGLTDQLADLSPGGELSSLTDFSSFGVKFDLLAVSPAGEIYALEDEWQSAPVGVAHLYRLSRPAALEVIGTIGHAADNSYVRYVGMDFTPTGELWLLESTAYESWRLRRIDNTTAQVLENIPLDYPDVPGNQWLFGLAFAESPVQVSPMTWGQIKAIYHRRRNEARPARLAFPPRTRWPGCDRSCRDTAVRRPAS
jgi:hypothetical protein